MTVGTGVREKVGVVWFYNPNGQDESDETLRILPWSIEENGV